MMKQFQRVCGCLAVLNVIVAASGQTILAIDQSLQPPDPPSGGSYHYDNSVSRLSPSTGQEFTPALPFLDFVDVDLTTFPTNNTGTFQAAIRYANITGPILGLSIETIKSNGGFSNRNTHFRFSNSVPLTQGEVYVIELIQLAGTNWGIELGGSGSINGQPIEVTYAGGQMIYDGLPQDGKDIIFREGILMPELSVTQSSSGFALSWRASATNFLLEANSDLLSSQWEVVTNQAVSTNGIFSLTIPADVENRFFRLNQQP